MKKIEEISLDFSHTEKLKITESIVEKEFICKE